MIIFLSFYSRKKAPHRALSRIFILRQYTWGFDIYQEKIFNFRKINSALPPYTTGIYEKVYLFVTQKASAGAQGHLVKKVWVSQRCETQFFVTIFRRTLDKYGKMCGLFANCG